MTSADIHLGTSGFVADGWEKSFYPKGMKPSDYLTYYATKFDTVEIDSTFYHSPPATTVNGWGSGWNKLMKLIDATYLIEKKAERGMSLGERYWGTR